MSATTEPQAVATSPEGAHGVTSRPPVPDPAGARTIDDVLASARARLRRLTPAAAHDALQDGALLVDIRPVAQRATRARFPVR